MKCVGLFGKLIGSKTSEEETPSEKNSGLCVKTLFVKEKIIEQNAVDTKC